LLLILNLLRITQAYAHKLGQVKEVGLNFQVADITNCPKSYACHATDIQTLDFCAESSEGQRADVLTGVFDIVLTQIMIKISQLSGSLAVYTGT
jgi:hypothetical protein